MGLDAILTKILDEKWDFAIAAGTYIAATATDYLWTAHGLSTGEIKELHPLLSMYVDCFGSNGILYAKAMLSTSVIIPLKILDREYKKHETKLRSEYFFYSASLLTAFSGASWQVISWGVSEFYYYKTLLTLSPPIQNFFGW